IDGGAVEGMVYISQGVADLPIYLRYFAIAHESSHVVTIEQAKQFGLGTEIPKGGNYTEYYKSEFLADLIATHQTLKHNPKQSKQVQAHYRELEKTLGKSDAMHPSGGERIRLLKRYHRMIKINKNPDRAFQNLFTCIWKGKNF
ncbi:MAG: hypothetical protein GY710_03555, partial [Desulfobacteraceae bacterium]|nr:hypothetical protein [Desulfobacteraceae bacterium]